MTLVAVVYLRSEAELAEGADTADTEEELLLETVLPVSTIEVVCDGPVFRKILRNVCIEELQFCAAYVYSPEACVEVTSRECDADGHPVSVFVTNR